MPGPLPGERGVSPATHSESRAPHEALTASERGRAAYDAITAISTGLRSTPAFSEALTKKFFARTVPGNRRGLIESSSGVAVPVGDYLYHVDYDRGRVHSERDRAIAGGGESTVTLVVEKYTDLGITGVISRAARAKLRTTFIEDGQGNVVSFTGGDVFVDDYSGSHNNTPEAVALVPDLFEDLYPKPHKI